VTFIDIIFIAIIILLAVKGAISGVISELFSLLSFIGALICSSIYYSYGAEFLTDHLGPSGKWNNYLGFILIFLVVFIIIRLIGYIIKKFVNQLHLQNFDHTLGFVAGLIEGLFLVFFIYYLIISQPVIPPEQIFKNSLGVKYIETYLPLILDYMPSIKG